MATKAKATNKKRTTAPAKKTTTSVAVATSKTTVRSKAVNKRSAVSWLAGTQSVFKPKTALGALLAEFVGTFVLASLFLTIGSSGQVLYIVFGLIGVTYATMRLSGGHLNPAISLAAWATRNITAWRLLGYVIAQVLGAMLALLVSHGLLPMQDAASALQSGGAAVYQLEVLTKDREWYFFFAQMLGTGIFAYIFASTWNGVKGTTGKSIAIAFGYLAGIFVAAQSYSKVLLDAVLNPAVAVSLGAVRWDMWALAVFVAAPAIGALIGASLQKLFANDVVATEAHLVNE